jgi:hypothetical protein
MFVVPWGTSRFLFFSGRQLSEITDAVSIDALAKVPVVYGSRDVLLLLLGQLGPVAHTQPFEAVLQVAFVIGVGDLLFLAGT